MALHFSSAYRSCWNVKIATRFPRAVGRVENLILVFHAFHRPSFQQLFCPGSVMRGMPV